MNKGAGRDLWKASGVVVPQPVAAQAGIAQGKGVAWGIIREDGDEKVAFASPLNVPLGERRSREMDDRGIRPTALHMCRHGF